METSVNAAQAQMLAEARWQAAREAVPCADFVAADAQGIPSRLAGSMWCQVVSVCCFSPIRPRRSLTSGRLAFLGWQALHRKVCLTIPLSAVAKHVPPPQLAGDGRDVGDVVQYTLSMPVARSMMAIAAVSHDLRQALRP